MRGLSLLIPEPGAAGADGVEQLLGDPCAEANAVDGTIEDAVRYDAIMSERGHESRGFPVAVRGIIAQAFAAWSPSPDRSHVGLDPGLVNEHQPLRVEPRLPALPALAPAGDIPAGLSSANSVFLKLMSAAFTRRFGICLPLQYRLGLHTQAAG